MIYKRQDTNVGIGIEHLPGKRHPILTAIKGNESIEVGWFKDEAKAILFMGVLEHLLGLEHTDDGEIIPERGDNADVEKPVNEV